MAVTKAYLDEGLWFRRDMIFEKIEGFSNMPRGGKRPGLGRKKGGTNKITADVRDAILKAFDMVTNAMAAR